MDEELPGFAQVLLCLFRAGGEVVTRTELFEMVWPGGEVSDDALTQCVVEIRKAFGETAKDAHIIGTIPKIGFRLLVPVKSFASDGEAQATSPVGTTGSG